ncbi:MAG: methyltransferase domain-containing protein [Gammaproteobacteria bacterium]|nr:methyltransferase domain-containing protein [Gammaproteobacteria bacterium]NIR90095.1 methyltransferase domain-containing protein [Gammaproteobacteria bacterium]NIU03300.1 methyltransferase domain-containing protein [Gammaproteobacteria bacterium]NIV50794.1 methyltransferase domain-containing protein [Gammaproteobacteria bacterium]NIV75379.1 methyltransferase domain-containing protein [Gammaproteobacteria bacterium]
MRTFYRVESIPVHSVLLMDSREQALEYPKRDMELGFCPRCAFIGNVVFDAAVHEYSTRYEETQGYSPTFSRFARELARRLVRTYDLGGKTVLEVGCGKGEFLVMLVEEGAGRGIGVDPAYREDRLESPALERLEFISDFYSERYAHLKADFVCCRHTLEHIERTKDFVAMVRRALGQQRGTIVFFELPDVVRELRDGAFWDLYYEHCSYFSPGSLARVFRGNGFEVKRIWREYREQYLMLTATPAEGTTRPRLVEEDDLGEMMALVESFSEACARSLSRWLGVLVDAKASGRRVALWGGGSKAVSFLTTLGVPEAVDLVVDVNPHKHGKFLPGTGHETVSPQRLQRERPDTVIAMNPVYVQEIQADLQRLEVDAEVLALD